MDEAIAIQVAKDEADELLYFGAERYEDESD